MTPTTLFEATAPFYAKYRPDYPTEAIEVVIARLGLGLKRNSSRNSRVLDLGCGTGQLAIPLADKGCDVIAVDPELDMLNEGIRRSKLGTNAGQIYWNRGSDKSIDALETIGVDGCVMGASFHWTNRPGLLHTLERNSSSKQRSV